ncbi:MAG: fibronectin type III domain-containing protein [Bacteroidia bacterium]|nr:fibronectin type III domain-containing protein [Bacteroidia bacterium]
MENIRRLLFVMTCILFTVKFATAQCPEPTGLGNVSLLGGQSAQLNWTSVAGSTGYNIEVESGQGNPSPFIVRANSAINTFTVNGLTQGLTYKFKVRTRCGGSKSDWTSWFQFVAGLGPINCVRVSGLAVSGLTPYGATFTWNASAGGLGYALEIEDARGNPVHFSTNVNSATNSYTITGLNPSSNYKVKVRKSCAIGMHSGWSRWNFFTTNPLRLASQSSRSVLSTTVQVYPNPAKDYIQLSVKDAEDENIQAIKIYDNTGRLVRNDEIESGLDLDSYRINISDLNNGIYHLLVFTPYQKISEKIVVAK